MGTNKRQTSVRKLLLIGKEKCENDWDRTLSQIIGGGGVTIDEDCDKKQVKYIICSRGV